MGSVYLGRSRAGRAVAIKLIKAEYAADPRFRDRFRKEVEAARTVGGFHTAAVVDADPDAPQPWMASAYIEGPTLADEVARRGPLDEARLWDLAAALAEALDAIHSCGLVHRDLKPGNIVLAEDGPRVLDFGIARALEGTRLTDTGAAIGTPGFIAPEQAQGLAVTGACDVFALGAVLVAAAGGSAFGSGQPYGLLYRVVHEEADVSAVPEGLRPVVAACLRKDPERRPTPGQLLDLYAGRTGRTAATATAVDHTATPPRSPAASEARPIALYLRSGRGWAWLILRNVLLLFGLIAVAAWGNFLYLPAPIRVLAAYVAFFTLWRFLVLLSNMGTEGLALSDLGIGVGYSRKTTVLRWSDAKSLELDTRGRKSVLTVRPTEGRGLPAAFRKPLWVRTTREGAIRIRTRWASPAAGTGPLPDTVRALASRHGIPLTEARHD
ncbi:serine/threonine-protein kinase [Streptomyces olivochromogenes]|uniref:serine/threonine-protein kinase n=1 Tax=Streptomyces olivochromogenes TaxID=1963 RepID=UPI0036DD9447